MGLFGGGGKSGAGGALAKKPTLLHSLRMQTSVEGQTLPVGIGTFRAPGKLGGVWDFKPITSTSTTAVGGKGGSQTVSTSTTTYQAAIMRFLLGNLMDMIGNVWGTQGKSGTSTATEDYILSTAIVDVVHKAFFTHDRGVSISRAVNHDYADYGDPAVSGNLTFGDWVPMKLVTGTPAAGEYKEAAGRYTFSATDVAAGAEVKIVYAWAAPDSSGADTTPVTVKNFGVFKGTRPQTAWSYLVSKHPTDARTGYPGVAGVTNDKEDLGSSATLENFNFECITPYRFGGGVMDASLDTIIPLMTTDALIGCGLPAVMLDSLAACRAYTVASGLFFSPYMDHQQPCADHLKPIMDAANCAPVWSGKKLKIIPYGDRTVAGRGEIFTPDTAPRYDLSEHDFICAAGEEPITVTHKKPREIKNIVRVEFNDRGNDYNPRPIQDQDLASIREIGEQPAASLSCPFICEGDVAARVAHHRRLRAVHIDPLLYEFTLGMNYYLLEPMELVTVPARLIRDRATLTETVPIRLLSKDEDPSTGGFKFTAEPFPFGTATPTLYTRQTPTNQGSSREADPGNVNPPIIFEASDRLSLTGGYELWLGLSGASENWGGCTAWASDTGDSYKYAGAQKGKARMGVLASNLAVGTALDVTNTLDVDLAMSAGDLMSGTADDRDNFRTLCWVEGTGAGQWELISYQTATLTSGNRYSLTSLRRGVYGTPILAHTAGQRFLRLDDAVTVIEFEPQDVGKTAHFKFPSFNLLGGRVQALPDVAEYTYAITGNFHNFNQVVGNDAYVTSVGTPGGGPFTKATVSAYGRVAGTPTPGTVITLKKSDGTIKTIPAQDFPNRSLSTTYWVMLNTMTWTLYTLSNYGDVITAVYWGHISLGDPTTTPDAAGAGTTSGGGGGPNGGAGGGGRHLTT